MTIWLNQLWLRYVDDTFTAVHKDEIDTLHEHLNRQNADIQFTREVEENGKIPFLDCLVSRHDNKPETTIYRKPRRMTFSLHANLFRLFEWVQQSFHHHEISHWCSTCNSQAALHPLKLRFYPFESLFHSSLDLKLNGIPDSRCSRHYFGFFDCRIGHGELKRNKYSTVKTKNDKNCWNTRTMVRFKVEHEPLK